MPIRPLRTILSFALALCAAAPTAVSAEAAVKPATVTAAPSKPRTEPVAAFTAFGTTSAWRAVVHDGVLELEGTVVPVRKINVQRSAFAKGVEFSGRDGRAKVVLGIRSLRCKDESGNDNEFSATLSYGRKTFKGCAVAGATPHAPT